MDMLLIIFTAVLFLLFPDVVAAGVGRGLSICAASILPALFPFFIVTDLWIRSGYAAKLSRAAAPITEAVFHLPGTAASTILMGAIGGYPMGARTVVQLYQQGSLSKHDAEQTLYFCNNAGPAFVFTILGMGVFRSKAAGAALYILHILSAFAVGFLLRPKAIPEHTPETEIPESMPLAQSITAAISQAGATTVQVCTFVLFFSILTQFLPQNTLLLGIAELAGGAAQLAQAAWSPVRKFTAAAFFLGFGGLCVQLQSQAILQQAGLSSKPVWIGKSMQAVLSAVLARFLAPLLPLASPCMAVSGTIATFCGQSCAILLLLLLLSRLFLKKTSGKAEINRI